MVDIISAPIFRAASTRQMLGRHESLAPDAETKKANPDKVKAFANANPEVLMGWAVGWARAASSKQHRTYGVRRAALRRAASHAITRW